ncbi:MAG: hypothetical protein V9G04_10140 [Nocardioides sp.]|jgi:hypothetical protein
MPDNKELGREIRVLRDKVREGEDVALAERRREAELQAAYGEARAARRVVRGF